MRTPRKNRKTIWSAAPWHRFHRGDMAPHSKGFTLIELLVVVTIIVVLLALLVPAMDKAIYHAEMMACGTNQKTVVTAAVAYAAGQRRFYPYRPTIAGQGWQRPNAISQPGLDDRPYLRDFMSLKSLVDPFSGGIDLEASRSDSSTFSNYELWFGMRFRDQSGRGLYKIGDRLTWTENSTPPVTYSFDVMVSCEDKTFQAGGLHDAHPDEDGRTAFFAAQDSPTSDGYGTGTMADGNLTISRWVGSTRGVMDLNYAFDDGSLTRYDDVQNLNEPRMTKVPWVAAGYNTASLFTHLPQR